jgi:hypothetical protein
VADKKCPFEHAGKDLLTVLNGLYRVRFLEVSVQLRRIASVYLSHDGVCRR